MLAKGKYIRFIDGDDNLKSEALLSINLLDKYNADALSSSFKIQVGKQLHTVSSRFLRLNPFDYDKFHSPPRWNWTLRKSFLDSFFPIPNELPFEDLYIAINIQLRAKKTIASTIVDYTYIQHSQQTYGGINKSSRRLVEFRAQRNLTVLEYLDNNLDLSVGVRNLFKEQQKILEGRYGAKRVIMETPYFYKIAFKLKMLAEYFRYNFTKNINYKIYDC